MPDAALEMPIELAPVGKAVWAYFPDVDDWRLCAQLILPSGAPLWSADTGIVVTPRGPSKWRMVHEPPRWLQ